MTEVVLGGDGRAVIHNRETGQAMLCSVPTALENVTNGGGVWVHGEAPAGLEPTAVADQPEPQPVIALTEPDVLPLPEPEPAAALSDSEQAKLTAIEIEVDRANGKVHPLDHDGDGRKGGSKPKAARGKAPADPERAAVVAALKAAGIKYFKAAPTEKLKTLLPG